MSKKQIIDENLEMIRITLEERCNNDECNCGFCILDCIRDGLANIYGVEFIVLEGDD